MDVPRLALTSEYLSCSAFGFNGEIKTSGCAYVLSGKETGSSEGSAEIECPEGQAIEVIVTTNGFLKCKATIGAQGSLTTVTFTNAGSGSTRDIKVDFNLSGIKYTQDVGEGVGKCEGGEFSNGEIIASPTVIGESSEKTGRSLDRIASSSEGVERAGLAPVPPRYPVSCSMPLARWPPAASISLKSWGLEA